jgi:integrase
MSKRQQLPPQIRKIEVKDRSSGKTVTRYQVTMDAGQDPATGKRRQVRRRFTTETKAREHLSEISGAALAGTFVARKNITVEQFCEEYINGRHDLKETALSKLRYDLTRFMQKFGSVALQRVTKAEVDALVRELAAGGRQVRPRGGFVGRGALWLSTR